MTSGRGWPAINFFYNTGIDANNQPFLDEPWSRPGDYVLLRALKDLICASSACPDDIDPANGWNPTRLLRSPISGEAPVFERSGTSHALLNAYLQMTRETSINSANFRVNSQFRGLSRLLAA